MSDDEQKARKMWKDSEEGTLDSEIQVIESVAQSINNEHAAKPCCSTQQSLRSR